MAKGYWIARIDVQNADGYQKYVEANKEPFRKHGARLIVRAGRFEAPEGRARGRNVIVEFESYQAALDCYRSPEYQRAVALRTPHSEADLVIIEGYDGPQP